MGDVAEQPVTESAALAESLWASQQGRRRLDEGVRRSAVECHIGIATTLLWLLGREEAPMRLPIRMPDGPLDVFLGAVAEFGPPADEAERRRLHEWSLATAKRSAESIEVIEQIRRRVLAGDGDR